MKVEEKETVFQDAVSPQVAGAHSPDLLRIFDLQFEMPLSIRPNLEAAVLQLHIEPAKRAGTSIPVGDSTRNLSPRFRREQTGGQEHADGGNRSTLAGREFRGQS